MCMFIRVGKEELNEFDYNNENELKHLVPFIMIKVAYSVYGDTSYNTVTVSVEQMWQLVTKGKRKLRSTQREMLVKWFKDYTGIEIDFETEFTFNEKPFGYYERVSFIKLEMKQIISIFSKYRLDNIDMAIVLTLRTLSHMNGEYIGMSEEDLLDKVVHSNTYEIYSDDDFDEKAELWFKRYTVDDVLKQASNFVAYPNVEDLLIRRYDTDEEMNEPFISEQNFNKHMKNLEEIGVICKVNTHYGQRKNKVVFCQVEHKTICESMYARYDALVEYAKKHKIKQPKKPKTEEVKEEPKPQQRPDIKQQRRARFR